MLFKSGGVYNQHVKDPLEVETYLLYDCPISSFSCCCDRTADKDNFRKSLLGS